MSQLRAPKLTANYKLVDIKSIDTRKNSSAYDLFGYLYKKNGDPVTSYKNVKFCVPCFNKKKYLRDVTRYTTLATTDLLDHAQNVHGVDLRNSSKDKVKEYLSKSKLRNRLLATKLSQALFIRDNFALFTRSASN